MAVLLKDVLQTFLYEQEDWRIRLLQNWELVVGALKTRVRLERIEGDTVILGVYESHWMQELFLLSRVLLKAINKQLDKPRVMNLRFKLVEKNDYKALPPVRFHELSPVLSKPLVLTQQQQQALLPIEDDQLRRLLISFLGRCNQRI